MYAAASLSSQHGYLGYVVRGCGSSPFKTHFSATLKNNDNQLEVIDSTIVCVYLWGNLFQIVLILLVSALFLHKYKKEKVVNDTDNTAQSTLGNYGIFWGCVTVSVMGNVLLHAHGIIVVYLHLKSGVFELMATGWMVFAQVVLTLIASLVVAIYYGVRLDFPIPSIFFLPFIILCCNHAVRAGKKIVQCLSIWSLLLFILQVCCRSSFIFLALLARPPVVITTVLLIIFVVFFSVYFLAIIFTFAKAKTKKRKRYTCSLVIDLAQALAVMVVFAAAICFGSLIGFAGLLANYGTIVNSPYSMLSTVITPLVLGGLGWALRKIGSEWLRSVTSSNTEEEAEMTPLLQEQKQKTSVNTEGSGGQMLHTRQNVYTNGMIDAAMESENILS